jgi:tetratricopeptide (TPR) repeat protein
MTFHRLPILAACGVLAFVLVAGILAFVPEFPSAPPPVSDVSTVPTPAAAPRPVADLFKACTETTLAGALYGGRPTAEQTVAACSTAIQSGKLGPDDLAAARLNRAVARIASGDRIMAMADYEEALRRFESTVDPSRPDALAIYRRGAALEGLGRTGQALTAYDEAIRVDPQGPLAYYGRAILLATRERSYVRAIADFDKVLALVPDSTSALQQRGNAYSQTGDQDRALVDLDRAIALDPADPRAWVYRGFVYQRKNMTDRALADFDAALKIDPRYVEALQGRGALHLEAGNTARAIRDFNEAISVSPHNAAAFFNRGYAFFLQKQYDLAIVDYGTAIYFESELGVAYSNRCLALAASNRNLVNALADCDHALKLMPVDIDVRETRGFVFLKLGDPAIAIAEYEAALRLDPNRPLALYGLGLAKIRMGLSFEGKADQDAAIALAPGIRKQFSEYGLN